MFSGVVKKVSAMKWVHTIKSNVSYNLVTSQVIHRANQLTGFYMARPTQVIKGLNLNAWRKII